LLLAAALMAGFVHYALTYLSFELSSASSIFVRAGTIMGLVLSAMLVYFVLAFVSGGADLGMVKRAIKKRRNKNAQTETS
jgi:putative peptidoglycan lipid II flippase